MFIKNKNPFARFMASCFMFGTLMNMDSPDEAGGFIGDSSGPDGSDEMSGGADSGPGAGGSVTTDADAGTADAGTADAGTADKGGAAVSDYDKRFSALDSKFDSLLSALNKNAGSGDEGKGEVDNDLSGLEHDDLVSMLSEDPAGFIGKITKVVESQVTNRVMQETANAAMNEKIEQTINSYADENPDFEKMWDDGTIKDFMSKNPGHNAISAHSALTMADKIAAAKKEGADEAIRNFRTKSSNQVLNGSIAVSKSDRDAALKDPGKFGGRAAVLAARAGIK